ncbi:hypothetical protein V3C99_013911 [Haemonchus contortus]
MGLSIVILLLELLYVSANSDEGPCHPYACGFGECIPEGTSFRCECRDDHVGPLCNIWRSPLVNCEVDGPHSCFNGGICNTTENEFRCVCPPTFTGLFCETDVDECSKSPCENGATCVNQIGSFYCMCPYGYKGATCEEHVEVCTSRTCLNGGFCIDGADGYVCQCAPGFSGRRCEEEKPGSTARTSVSTENVTPTLCADCPSKAGNGRCDKECDRPECLNDGGDCTPKNTSPFNACAYAEYCARVFHDGICDKICNNEKCLFDGFDCLPKTPECPSRCKSVKHNGICDEECNREECDFDGGDCELTTKILSGELSIVVLIRPEDFAANVVQFIRSLSLSLRSDIRIKHDDLGPMAFAWNEGEIGERLILKGQGSSPISATPSYSTGKEGVLVWIEVDVSKCVEECFDDVEVVARFIEADKNKLSEALSMSIYSAVGKKPRIRHDSLGITLLFVVACVSLMILVAFLFIVQQRGSRKRKVIENAPVWIPPTEFENQKSERIAKERSRHDFIDFKSAKRKRLDPAEVKLLEDKLTPNVPRVRVVVKPKKLEPKPSKLHMEAALNEPLSSLSANEDINRKGPYGRTPVMVLVRNTLKTEDQLIEELTKLHAAGADLNLCDDCDDTALLIAVSSGRVAIVRKLLQLGASPVIRDRTNSTCLHLAVRACALNMTAALLENEEMRQEVDALDDENRTALMLAAMYDMVDTKIAEMLCDAGAKVNYDGDNSLTTWKGRTALHFAAKYNNTGMVAFLLEKNANKDCQDYECCTPLHLAASEDHVGPIKELLKVGASVMLRNDKSQTPYDTALVNNSENVAALLASGDNLRVQLYSNNGEIFASSRKPDFKCAKVLMARHTRNVRGPHSSVGSPRSTQSTPIRCMVTSPYSHISTPHSVAAFGSNYSPQYPNPAINVNGGPLSSPHCVLSSGYSVHANPPLCGSVAPTDGVVLSPHCIEGQMISVSKQTTVMASPGFFDSGYGSGIDRSSCSRSAPWSGSEGFFKSNERVEPADNWIVSNGECIV